MVAERVSRLIRPGAEDLVRYLSMNMTALPSMFAEKLVEPTAAFLGQA